MSARAMLSACLDIIEDLRREVDDTNPGLVKAEEMMRELTAPQAEDPKIEIKMARAIYLLYVQGILPDRQAEAAERRLEKWISRRSRAGRTTDE